MDAPTNPNHSPTPKSNIYHISGVPVEFPYKPYGTQLAFMSRVISTLDRANRQGHCHALLESPTGTGKTLSLLCSSLAWQKHQSQRHFSHPNSSVSPPPEFTDPYLHGGGFIVEADASGNPCNPPQTSKVKAQKKRTTPNIYYASRTHSQISQVIREYKRTAYRVSMAVLASRKHYCTNKHVCGNENVDAVCKLLLKDPTGGCLEFKNANKVKSHPSIQIGGCLEVHDIEDLVRIGQHVKGCSYFAAQMLAAEAQLIFCPYSYIINPIVRRSMDMDIKGCILIIDEAHNIEDMARESGSVDIEEEVLHELQAELGQLCLIDNLVSTYRPLYDVVQGIISWINVRKDNLQKSDFEHYLSYWTGEKAKQELQQSGISQQYFPILQECAIKAIKSAYDAAPGETHLTGISLITLESLFSSLSYFFSQNGCYANDYQLVLQRFVKRDGKQRGSAIEFDQVLRSYYDTISRKNKPVSRKIQSGLKLIQKRSSSKGSSQISNKGAAFLAVCRGKVSEGIDFSDDNARVVVIVGIPFPNKNDTQVMLKKKFNDTYKSSKNLLSGSEWYCHQAFRALNQAAGRCIRHRFDYGAIILLDERYKEQRNLAYISKWLRSSIKSYNSFDESLEALQTFFRDAKQRQILEGGSNEVIDYNNNKESPKPFKSSFQVTASKRNKKLKDFNNHIGKMDPDKKPLVKIDQILKISTGLVNDSFPVFQPQTPVIKSKEEEDEKLLKDCINVGSENKSLKHFSAQTLRSESSPDLVKDTCDSSEVEYLPVFHNFHPVSELPSSLSCITTSSILASHDACLKVVTPDKLAYSVPSDTEHCPHFDSVNSYNHKKRRLKGLQSTSFPEIDCSNACFSESTDQLDLTNSTNISQITNPRTELSFENNKKVELGLSKPPNKCISPPFSDFYEEKELLVCCSSCKKPLGLPENRFLIKSFMMLSSKVYLSYIRKYGTLGVFIPDCHLKTARMSMHVLTIDISLINERIFKERAKKNFPHDGIWCEEDGCVFRAIFCPFCTAFDACIGAHVLATDASNANLLNKVLLYADRVCVSDESKAFNEGVLTKCGNLLDDGSGQVESKKYTSSVLLKKPAYDPKRKPTALMKNADFPNPWLVNNAKCVGKVQTNKLGYTPKMRLNSAKEHVDNLYPRPVDIEKFAYKPQGKLATLESFPSNVQRTPEQIAKSAFCSNSITTAKSRLKLPIRRQKTTKKLRNPLAGGGVPDI